MSEMQVTYLKGATVQQSFETEEGDLELDSVRHDLGPLVPGSALVAELAIDPALQGKAREQALRQVVNQAKRSLGSVRDYGRKIELDLMIAACDDRLFVLVGELEEEWTPSLTSRGVINLAAADGRMRQAEILHSEHHWQPDDWQKLGPSYGGGDLVGGSIVSGIIGSLVEGLSGGGAVGGAITWGGGVFLVGFGIKALFSSAEEALDFEDDGPAYDRYRPNSRQWEKFREAAAPKLTGLQPPSVKPLLGAK